MKKGLRGLVRQHLAIELADGRFERVNHIELLRDAVPCFKILRRVYRRVLQDDLLLNLMADEERRIVKLLEGSCDQD